MTQFFWDTPPPKGRREVLNPRPIVPETGWKRPTSFPDLSSASAIGFDVETKDKNLRIHGAGWGRGDGHIVGLAISTDDGFSGYYPVRHEDEPEANFDPATVFRWAREQLSRPYQTKVGHNITYDIGWLKAEGVPVIGPLWDTWVAEKLLRFRNEASLEATGQRRVGEGKQSTLLLRWLHQYYGRGRTPEDDDLDESQKGNLYRAPARLVGPYGESDVILPLKVGLVQGPLLEELGMMELFEMECELIRLFVEMRWKGVRVDIPAAEAADHKLGQELEVLSKEIWHIGGRLNPNSGEEVGRALQKLGFKVPTTPKTGKFSVTDDLLGKIDHPLAEKVSEWRELNKFQSTFIRGAILKANVKGVVHGTLNQLRAITGRMSCSDPNLQNIPSRNEELMQTVRGIFVPWEGHAYWRKDDYSSIESRLLAHFATGVNSEELREEYRNNPDTDYHNFTTAMVKKETGLDLPRKSIKQVNFSICIAEGQLVLTQRGNVPIQEVLDCDLVWDGVEWVSHAGVIYKGTKEVITYEQLTATPNHKIWTSSGDFITLQEASAQQAELCRTETAFGEVGSGPRRVSDIPGFSDAHTDRLLSGGCGLQEMWGEKAAGCSQFGKGFEQQVPVSGETYQVSRQSGLNVGRTLQYDGAALSSGYSQTGERLSGSRYQGGIYQSGRVHPLGSGKVAGRNLQEEGVRPDRQRRELFQRESAVSHQQREQTELAEVGTPHISCRDKTASSGTHLYPYHNSKFDLPGIHRRANPGEVSEELQPDREESVGKTVVTKIPVYDILNAGPRRRFTCQGVLVSNCYGAGEDKLAKTLKLSKEEVVPFFAAYHSGMPYVSDTMDSISLSTTQRGYTQTIMGRRVDFDLWEPKYKSKDDKRPALQFAAAVAAFGPQVQRAYLHKALNYTIQGSAADLMKKAMLDCWKAGVYDVTGVPLLIVHDEKDFSASEDSKAMDEAFREMKHIMETAIKFKVPIKVEGERGANWGHLSKITAPL